MFWLPAIDLPDQRGSSIPVLTGLNVEFVHATNGQDTNEKSKTAGEGVESYGG